RSLIVSSSVILHQFELRPQIISEQIPLVRLFRGRVLLPGPMMPSEPLTFVRGRRALVDTETRLRSHCIIRRLMSGFFARRTSWNLATNRYTEALEAHRRAGKEVLDLTASNPTTVGFQYRGEELLQSLARHEALIYAPDAKGLLAAREAIAAYYAERGSLVSPDDLILTTGTSEAYSFVFRLLCDPGKTVLVPT